MWIINVNMVRGHSHKKFSNTKILSYENFITWKFPDIRYVLIYSWRYYDLNGQFRALVITEVFLSLQSGSTVTTHVGNVHNMDFWSLSNILSINGLYVHKCTGRNNWGEREWTHICLYSRNSSDYVSVCMSVCKKSMGSNEHAHKIAHIWSESLSSSSLACCTNKRASSQPGLSQQ